MRITIVTGPWLPVPALQGGAIPRLWQGLAEEFVKQGHEACIFARAFPGQPSKETIHGVRYIRWGGFEQSLSIKRDLMKDFIYAALAVKQLPQANILITNSFWFPLFAGFFQNRVGRIVINAARFPKSQYWLYLRAARVAAVSNAIRDAIAQQTPTIAARTKVFPNPIDTKLLTPITEFRNPSMQKTLLFVGRMHPEKGVHLLIEAFNCLSPRHLDWRLRLVGPIAESQGGGGSAYEKRLRDLAHGVPVEFSGPIFDAAQLAEVYRSADLFCYPSLAERGESFGVAPLEAMATGMAPVVSSLACFHDFISENETGFYFDHRVADPANELAIRLEHAMDNWQHTLTTGKRAAEVAQRFSYTQVARKYLADFEELLEGKPYQ